MSNALTGFIVLLIIVILIDGFRRTYNARRNRLDVSPALKKRVKNTEPTIEPEENLSFTSELPNGGARVVGYRDPLDAALEKKSQAQSEKEQRRRDENTRRSPEQSRLNLEESVPLLMEAVPHSEHERLEPKFSAQDDEHHDDDAHDHDDDDYDDEEYDDDDYDDEDYDEKDYDEDEEHADDEPAAAASTPQADPEEVLIINIMAHKGQVFAGNDLLDIVLKCGLRYGSMDIFHRYSDAKGEGALLFSMANMVKPGTFDLDAMDEFSTPGISLFMTLPIEADSMKSFELMVETAQAISQTLGGELKDEQRSVMTRQTLEHCRQRINDFERKKLFRRPR